MVAPIDYTLNVQSPFEAAVQGFQFGRGIQQAKQQDADYARQQFDLLDAEKKNAALSFGYQTLGAIESGNIPLAKQMLTERATAFRNAGDELQAKSYEDAAAAAEMNPAWAKTTIDYMMRSLDPEYDSRMAKLRGGDAAKAQWGEGTIVDINGVPHYSRPVFDPNTSTMTVKTVPVGGSLLSKRGLTPQQEADLSVDAEYRKAVAKVEAGVATAEDAALVEQKVAAAKAVGQKQGEAQQDFAAMGVVAVDAMPDLYQTVNLLKKIETGGAINEVSLYVKRKLGIESADEGELSFQLGKNVLSQLRTLFGAAFTAKEGDTLATMEAGFGKNNGTNLRLIERAIGIAERSARRGLAAAKRAGDDFQADEIQKGLDALEAMKKGAIAIPPPPPGAVRPRQ